MEALLQSWVPAPLASQGARPLPVAERVLEFWLAKLPRLPVFCELQADWNARTERSFLRLPEFEGFEAWLVGWPQGTSAPLHDHGSAAGVAGTLIGRLHEALHSASTGRWSERSWEPGAHMALARGICHEVRNLEADTAYSVHVYEPRLERMTFYDRGAHGSVRPVRVELAQAW